MTRRRVVAGAQMGDNAPDWLPAERPEHPFTGVCAVFLAGCVFVVMFLWGLSI